MPNFHCVVLYPAVVREVLREFLLSHGEFIALRVEYQGAAAGSALVDRENAVVHADNLFYKSGLFPGFSIS